MDTIKAPPHYTSEKGPHEHGIVATICDDRRFHLVFDERLDADLQPELDDFSLVIANNKAEVESLVLKSGLRNGKPWAVITFNLKQSIKPNSKIKLKYHPRQFFLWSEEREEQVEGFELKATAADKNSLQGVDLQVKDTAAPVESEALKVKTDARIVEASERQIRIALEHDLQAGQSPKIEDFRAETNIRCLSVDRVYVTRFAEGAELSLLLREEIEPKSLVKVSYKPGRRPLRVPSGEYLDTFSAQGVANNAADSEQSEHSGTALDDIDQLLELAHVGDDLLEEKVDDNNDDSNNVVMLFSGAKESKSDEPVKEPKTEARQTTSEPAPAERDAPAESQQIEQKNQKQGLETGQEIAQAKVQQDQPNEASNNELTQESTESVSAELTDTNAESQAKANDPVDGSLGDPIEETQGEIAPQSESVKPRPVKKKAPEPVLPQKLVITSLEDGSEQHVDPDEAFFRVDVVEEEVEEQDQRSALEKLRQAGPFTMVAAAVATGVLGWALFAFVNFAALIFSIGVDDQPKPNLIEHLNAKKAGSTKASALAEDPKSRQPCELTLDDGSTYKGSCFNGMKDGGGTLNYANGDSYSGEWTKDQRHGNGMFQKKNGQMYAGSFKEDMQDGRGTYRWPNGRNYEGEFANNQFHGQGVLIEVDGMRFEGRFENGEAVEGTCFKPDGTQTPGPCKTPD